MDKQKIALIASSPATVNAFLVAQIRSLSKYYDVFVITNTTDYEYTLKDIADIVTIIDLPIIRDINPFKDIKALLKLFIVLKKQKFALVHSFTPKAGLLSSITAAASGTKCRIHTFTGQVWANLSGYKRFILKSCDKLIVRLNTHILIDSNSQKEFLKSNKIVNKKCSVLAHGSISGVDINRFTPSNATRSTQRSHFQLNKDAIIFLFIGRLKIDKGVLDLAHAFKRMKDDTSLIKNTFLIIAGTDEESLKPEIEEILSAHTKDCLILPHTSTPESLMQLSDVLCLPSYREGFGSVVIEAASCGLPAIGTKIYGLTDAIQDNETGLLTNRGDVEALSICMHKLAQDDKLRKQLSLNAITNAHKYFSQQRVVKAWLDYYNKMLSCNQ